MILTYFTPQKFVYNNIFNLYLFFYLQCLNIKITIRVLQNRNFVTQCNKLNIVIIHFMTKSTITSEKIYLCVKSS